MSAVHFYALAAFIMMAPDVSKFTRRLLAGVYAAIAIVFSIMEMLK